MLQAKRRERVRAGAQALRDYLPILLLETMLCVVPARVQYTPSCELRTTVAVLVYWPDQRCVERQRRGSKRQAVIDLAG